MMMCSDDLICA